MLQERALETWCEAATAAPSQSGHPVCIYQVFYVLSVTHEKVNLNVVRNNNKDNNKDNDNINNNNNNNININDDNNNNNVWLWILLFYLPQ